MAQRMLYRGPLPYPTCASVVWSWRGLPMRVDKQTPPCICILSTRSRPKTGTTGRRHFPMSLILARCLYHLVRTRSREQRMDGWITDGKDDGNTCIS
jgi:hypothetical protein